MNKLVLFDIDKTLIGGAVKHRETFKLAFKQVYGVDAGLDTINTYGMTDREALIEILKVKGLSENQIFEKMHEAVRIITENYKDLDDKGIHALPGTKELLKTLRGKVILGLVTGNMKAVAYGKLKYVGFDKYFKFGGFGDDALDRADLLRIAIRRAVKKYNFKFNNNVYHFGDTPRDVEIGTQKGITSIGVATGIYSKEELKKAGADYVLDNLKNTKKVLEIINGRGI